MLDQAEILRLEPLSGPNAPSYDVTPKGQTMIGRASDCDFHLSHPNVSRHHALLAHRNQRWLLTDLGGRAGTFLNGLRLEPNAPAVAMFGDLVRLGPFTFRVEAPGDPMRSYRRSDPTAEVTFAPGAVVMRATEQELEALAARRLELLMDGAEAMHRAASERALGEAVMELILDGSGFQRGALLRHTGAEPEVLAFKDLKRPQQPMFGLSRSMIKEAELGHVVRLSGPQEAPTEQSICTLGIHSAVCCPILLDSAVLGYLYVDSRGIEEACYPDAVGFCNAVTRLAGLCLANLKRSDLQMRQTQLEKDLKTAREAQTFLGPPNDGTIGHVRYAAKTTPGRVVAGDLFDIFSLDSQRVAVCFGDVCGQGMGSAILMTAILSHLRSGLTLQGDPVAAVSNINAYLLDRSSLETFATLIVGVFDREKRALHYVDAGHGHWLVKRSDGTIEPAPLPDSIVIGVEVDFAYEIKTLELGVGDRLILYSDGVVEHTSSEGEEFGHERLLEAIKASPDLDHDIPGAMNALLAYIGGGRLEDDTTLASLQILE